MKLEIIPDWRHAWKWVSVNCMALTLAIDGSWLAIPQDMRDHLPNHIASLITVALMALGILGRFVKQTPVKAKKGKK